CSSDLVVLPAALEHRALHAGRPGRLVQAGLRLRGHHERERRLSLQAQLPHEVDAAARGAVAEAEIDEQQLRAPATDELLRLGRAGSLSGDVELGPRQAVTDPRAHERVIVDDENRDVRSQRRGLLAAVSTRDCKHTRQRGGQRAAWRTPGTDGARGRRFTSSTMAFSRLVDARDTHARNGSPLLGDGDCGTLLVVEDDPIVRTMLGRVLSSAGYSWVSADGVGEAEELLRRVDVALVVTDVQLHDRSGLELLGAVEELSPDTATVVVTGLDDPAVAELARGRAHGRGALRRPGDAERAGAQRAALPRRRLPQRRDRPLARHRGRHGARAHPQRHAQARRGDADAGDRDRDAPPPDRVGRDPSRPPWRSARAGAASGRYPYGVCRAGSTSRKRLPCPTSESSSTRPPSARASSRAIGSP